MMTRPPPRQTARRVNRPTDRPSTCRTNDIIIIFIISLARTTLAAAADDDDLQDDDTLSTTACRCSI